MRVRAVLLSILIAAPAIAETPHDVNAHVQSVIAAVRSHSRAALKTPEELAPVRRDELQQPARAAPHAALVPPPPAVPPEPIPSVTVLHGARPADSRYRQYTEWYGDHAVVSLAVRGRDREHLIDALARLVVLREQGVLVGELLVVDSPWAAEIQAGGRARTAEELSKRLSPRKFIELAATPVPSELGILGKSLGLTHTGDHFEPQDLLGKFDLAHSPSWIVRYRGEDYVYDGYKTIRHLFDSNGRFTAGGSGNTSGEHIESFYLDDIRVPNRVHEKRRTSEMLFERDSSTHRQRLHDNRRFQFVGEELPVGAGTFDGKPHCSNKAVRYDKVLLYTRELQLFDIVYYDDRDPIQRLHAEAWPMPTAPFLEGDLRNPYRVPNLQQDYARLFPITCLPTRLRVIQRGAEHFYEFREGEQAWEVEDDAQPGF